MTHPTSQHCEALLDGLEEAFAQFGDAIASMDAKRDALALALAALMRASFLGEVPTTEAARIVTRVLEVGRQAEALGARLRGPAMPTGGE